MIDIPSVSIRNPLLPQIFAHPELVEKWYGRDEKGEVDLRHVRPYHCFFHHFRDAETILHRRNRPHASTSEDPEGVLGELRRQATIDYPSWWAHLDYYSKADLSYVWYDGTIRLMHSVTK